MPGITLTSRNRRMVEEEYIRSLMPVFWTDLSKHDGNQFVSDDATGNQMTTTGTVRTNLGRVFNGSTDYITCAVTPQLFMPNGMTVMFWVNMASIAHTGNDQIIGKSNETTSNEWRIFFNAGDAGGIRVIIGDATFTNYIGRRIANANNALQALIWTCVVANWTGGILSSNITIYKNNLRVDDTDVQSGTFAGISNTGQAMIMGADGTGTPSAFTPIVLDNVVVCNRSLTLYEQTKYFELTKWRYL